MNNDIGTRAVRGAAWLGSGQMLRQALAFATNIILARTLFPDDFGLFALAFAAAEIAQILTDFGLGAAIIQRQEKSPVALTTCFWLTMGVGSLIAILLILGGPLLANFYGRPEVVLLVIPLAINMLICASLVVPQAVLTQDLKFREITIAQIIGSVFASVGAISLAVAGTGVWALASQPAIGNIITGLMLFYFSRWRPTGMPRLISVQGMMSFSWKMLSVSLISSIGRNLHAFILGKQLSATALGHYNLASGITGSILFQISSVIVKVMFPTLASMRDESTRLPAIWIKASSAIAIVSLPTMAGVIAVAPDLVPVVFGMQWIPATDVLRILCVVMAVQSVLTTAGTVLMALGRADILLRITLTTVPAIGLALWYGVKYGIEGAAMGYALVNIVSYVVTSILACHEIKLTSSTFFLALAPWAFASIIMALAVAGISNLLDDYSPWARLIISILAGIILYASILLLIARQQTISLVGDITSRLRRS